MVCTGFARYLVTVPVAPELPPVTVSPVTNLCCDVIKSLGVLASKSSTRTVAVAFEVPPVIVSPTVNLPSLLSKTLLSVS